ncbi:NAD kinase [Cryomorphaceae bacterium 1068]|nr:NAD kinase [Cryomorphaceae bacterium 1068]
MKIAIYGKPFQNELNNEIAGILDIIDKRGFEPVIYERYARFLNQEGYLKSGYQTFNREDVEIKDYCCLVSIGGDGTLLDTVTLVRDSNVPIVGLNAGRLGFISSLSVDELTEVLTCLENGDYEVDKRNLLQVETSRNVFGKLNFGLNEVTLHKKDTASMIKIETYVNNEFLNTYWADGLIISTPTGSTAYSLSCGGPIIVPGSENFVITPIAPHNLNVRPVVVSNNVTLKLRADGRTDNLLLAIDSRPETIFPNEEIKVSKSPFTISLLKPKGHTFLNTMRNKLAWGFDKRN